MPSNVKFGTFPLGNRQVSRLGYGAMQLAGPGVFGPPKDHYLRENLAAPQLALTRQTLDEWNGIAS